MVHLRLSKHGVLMCFVAFSCLELLSAKAVLTTTEPPQVKSDAQKYFDITHGLETNFKSAVKGLTRTLLPHMMRLNEEANISSACTRSLMKYVTGLTKAKIWATKMLDSSSKIPPGVLVGTFSDFGSFDECLDVEVRHKNGTMEFRGSSCAVEARPPLPPLPQDYNLAKAELAQMEDTLGDQFRKGYGAIHHKQVRMIVCVPSTCSLQDVQNIAVAVEDATDFKIKIPMCYVKDDQKLTPVQIAFIFCLALLLVCCIAGAIVEKQKEKQVESKEHSMAERIIIAFSLTSNFKRFVAPSGGSAELKCIHGIRALGMCWIILGHTYVFMDFELLKAPFNAQTWFASVQFEFIHNGWLSVETFFLLSGILVAYAGLKAMEKTKGKINIPLMVLRRYVRLTPPILLLMGMVFFLPQISSGPFYYDQVGTQVESCRKYWWTTLLYFSNWWGIDKSCLVTTWYLAADFQLHILSLILLIIIFRYAKVGVSLLFFAIASSCFAVAIMTAMYHLTPTIQLATGDNQKVFDVLNRIHIHTLTHLGPHCIGMVLGYYIYKYKEQKLSKVSIALGWCVSITVCFATVLGSHRFAAGEETSYALSLLYSGVHRSAFIAGVAWVAFACIRGYGGPVNGLLSSSMLAPPSRLTFMVYLVHPLVIWTKLGSLRERPTTTHYEFVYTYIANVATSFVLAIPFYLLLEAPLSNLDRLIFSGRQKNTQEEEKQNPPPTLNNVSLMAVKRFPQELRSRC